MATTVSDITSLASEVKTKIAAWQASLDSIQASLTTLYNADPLPTNATETYNDLVKQRDIVSAEWTAYTGYSDLLNLFNQAAASIQGNPSVQEAMFSTSSSNLGVEPSAKNLTNFARNQQNSTSPNAVTFPTVKAKITTGAATPGAAPAGLIGGGTPAAGGGAAPPSDDAGTARSIITPSTTGSTPGRRLQNPLGWFSSYTYQISLYMISPQGYNQFIASGKTRLPAAGQYYIIAQSGGIPADKRAPGNRYDFYIDNLRIAAAVGMSATGTSTFNYDLSFQVVEPYGFTLPTIIRDAGETLVKNNQGDTSAGNIEQLKNQTKQTFIIGLRFLGYDSAGNVMSASNVYDGKTLDPAYNQSTSQGLFERYFDFKITEFKFNIDGKAVTYNIKGGPLNIVEGAGLKRGMLDNYITIQGKNVKGMLQSLIEKLNAIQTSRKEDEVSKQKINYNILWDYPGFDTIGNASMLVPEDVTKFRAPVDRAENSQDANFTTEARSTPYNTEKFITFNAATPILQCINQIIMQSTYLRDAMEVVYKDKLVPNGANYNDNQVRPDTKKAVKWYNITPELSNPRWDESNSDWAYDITYIIKPYETPVFSSAYVAEGTPYYGPWKRYDYWFTGQNSEILNYDQKLDNNYFIVALNPNVGKDGQGTGGDADISNAAGKKVNQDTTGSVDTALQAQANYLTDLTDPNAIAVAKITILGDPDYLMQPGENSADLGQEFRRYFGNDGYTINPTSGQVFIEIDFKAPIDYDTQKGYMSINDNIIFWKYPNSVKDLIKGISYRVIKVTSQFQGGKFTQVLECALNTFKDAGTPGPADRTTE